MARISVENLSFRYPEGSRLALSGISFDVEAGSYVLICGKSACGKSTLLRHMKSVLAPHGERVGAVLFDGKPLNEVSLREQAGRIGFVMQNPDAQLVTDKVWHELAFGLENLGLSQQEIRLRVSEMASYFGMHTWFNVDVNCLSGGQKQLLNLAAVMVMQPDVLVLDEPTSQLDPIAASDFLETIARINRELGVTVIISEHRLEEVFPCADKLIVMDEGRILAQGDPRDVGASLFEADSDLRYALPTPMRVYGEAANLVARGAAECSWPITVREGRAWLGSLMGEGERQSARKGASGVVSADAAGVALEAKGLWLRYGRDLPDVLKGADLQVRSGRILAVVGGNGAGKSTLLKALVGIVTPYRGSIALDGVKRGRKSDPNWRVALLDQDPLNLFACSTVRGELEEMLAPGAAFKPQDDPSLRYLVEKLDIAHLLDMHPYDLSGGEQQRVALAKVLMAKPRVLLLDEPTKGLDAFFKRTLAAILADLKRQGMAIVLVSHDLEFCARYADDAAMLFDGAVMSAGPAHELFAGNSFYTTAANRMSRHLVEGLVTDEDVIAYVG